MRRDSVKDAIARLRQLKKAEAGEAAWEYAVAMLPVAAKYKTPTDLAALLIVAVALYHTAASRNSQQFAAEFFVSTIQKRHRLLSDGTHTRDIFRALDLQPQKLQQYRQILLELPSRQLQCAFETVLQETAALRGGAGEAHND